jgi:hypothetical protein
MFFIIVYKELPKLTNILVSGELSELSSITLLDIIKNVYILTTYFNK